MENDFRKSFLDNFKNFFHNKEIEGIKKIERDNEFIEALTILYKSKSLELYESNPQSIELILTNLRGLSDKALSTEKNILLYSYFIFLNSLQSKIDKNWWEKAIKKYRSNAVFKYFFAYATSICGIETEFDSVQLLSEALKEAPTRIIYIYRKYMDLATKTQKENLEIVIKLLKDISPNSSDEELKKNLDMINSIGYAIISEYYLASGNRNEAEKIIKENLKLWDKNPISLCISAYIDIDKNYLDNAKEKLLNSKEIAENKYYETNLPSLNQIPNNIFKGLLINIYAGLSFIFSNYGCYEESLDYCNRALKLNPSKYIEARIRLIMAGIQYEYSPEKAYEDYKLAEKEFENIKNLSHSDYKLESILHNNLGVLYYDNGLYEEAKKEYKKSITINNKMAEAYNNIAAIYNEENQIERAQKLVNTAHRLNKNLKIAEYNLDRLNYGKRLDWWDWWFGFDKQIFKLTNTKQIFGAFLLTLLFLIIVFSVIMLFMGKNISNLILGFIGVILLIIIFPMVQRIELGNVKLETKPIEIKKETINLAKSEIPITYMAI